MSQCSQASTVIYENSQDPEFIQELISVDRLYFQELSQNNETSTTNSPVFNLTALNESDSDQEETVNNDESDDDDDFLDDLNIPVTVVTEPTDYDKQYRDSVETFINKTCGCTKLYGKPCSTVINNDDLVSLHEFCSSLEREELDLVIQSALFTHRHNGPKTSSVSRHHQRDRQRPSQKFFIKGVEVCRQVFCFAYCVGREKLMKIGQFLDENGLNPRVHGNKNKLPHNALQFNDREQIKQFLLRYAKENAMPLPGRLPNHRQSKVLLLPSDKRQADVHEAYLHVASELGLRKVSLTTFVRTWHDLCPQIVLCKPSTDLCHKCQTFNNRLSNSGNLPEQQKSEILENFTSHIKQAQLQREEYKIQCENSKMLCSSNNFLEGAEPCSLTDTTIHYSWDFAQQVFIPHHSQQVGPIFFKTPRKCEVFGVCCEGTEKQVFFLCDEGLAPGKGANTVISYVHHYLATYGLGETTAQFHFDNCCAQNKNNAVLWYAMWRVMTGLHVNIQYNLMVAGHTKFSPDWHFGLWKSRWRRIDAETVEDVATSVDQSSKNGHNVSHLVDDHTSPVTFYNWKKFLASLFRPLKNITMYHSFHVSSCEPGVVVCKEFSDSQEVRVSLIRKGASVTPGMLPDVLYGPGLDAERQWYLFDQIRPFFKSDSSKNLTCPLPKLSKPQCCKKMKI